VAVQRVRSIERALAILEAVAEQQPVGVAELARTLADDKSAVQRALVTLHAAGWIQPDGGEPTRWELTARPLVVAARAERRSGLHVRVRAALEALRDATGETAIFAALDGHRVVVVDTVESQEVLRSAPPLGLVIPTTTGALGRAILAALPPDELEHFPDVALDAPLRAELVAVLTRGWSRNAPDVGPGTKSVGAAVVQGGRPVGAIAVTAPASRLPASAQDAVGRHVANAAAALSNDDEA